MSGGGAQWRVVPASVGWSTAANTLAETGDAAGSRFARMPQPFTVIAQNLPEHARNPIHTDEGARAAGFERALVAGVTTYTYMTHPIVEAWGLDWLTFGGGEVRFRRPVFAGDTLQLQADASTAMPC